MIRLGLRVPLWRRESITKRLLSYYAGMRVWLRGHSIDLVLVAVESEGLEYIEAVDKTRAWVFVHHPNDPLRLGDKLAAGLQAFQNTSVVGVINIGSDDFIAKEAVLEIARRIADGADLIGWSSFYYAHAEHGMKRWPGYPPGHMCHGQPIGAGRAWSRALLDKLGWNLWPGLGKGTTDGYGWREACRLGDCRIDIVSSESIGPLVDVKGPSSVSKWSKLREYNEDVPIEEAREILKRVGLGGYCDAAYLD